MKSLFCLVFSFMCAEQPPADPHSPAVQQSGAIQEVAPLLPTPPTPSTHFSSAVILQYHHVSDSTPASTSVTPEQLTAHLDWLQNNHFTILPLDEVVHTLRSKQQFDNSRIASITFDDANISVCKEAWPILKERNIPFTLFINTEPVEKGFQSQCRWQDMKVMLDSGLMLAGNHAHTHLYMIRDMHQQVQKDWESKMRKEISMAESLIEKHLGVKTRFFAYPYGEYNSALEKLVDELGYIGFGQHSGAIGPDSDFLGLPRFPASGQFAKLETLSTKLNSLAFPADVNALSENPIAANSPANPPALQLKLKRNLQQVSCFDSSTGKRMPLSRNGNMIQVKAEKPLGTGRHRYNCTSPSEEAMRFYWISHQWVVE